MSIKSIAMVPARIGSTRLKMKNLALINGRPMISHALRAAIDSGAFDRVVVNADHPLFEAIAREYGAEFYLRPAELGSSTTKSDDVVADFMTAHPAEAVAWVNPISPLMVPAELCQVVEHFFSHGLDSLITVETKQVHCDFDGKPVNYSTAGKFAQTQELVAVNPFVYSVMMWRSAPFLADMARQGHAVFCGRFGTFPVSRLTALIVKTDEDLMIADFIARALAQGSYRVEYHALADQAGSAG
jgi:CMP-N-acetylneuraminic acid synthetase